jgi:hypothetical protein
MQYDPTAKAKALREKIMRSMSYDELLDYALNSVPTLLANTVSPRPLAQPVATKSTSHRIDTRARPRDSLDDGLE